jgi:hypothetical protein
MDMKGMKCDVDQISWHNMWSTDELLCSGIVSFLEWHRERDLAESVIFYLTDIKED